MSHENIVAGLTFCQKEFLRQANNVSFLLFAYPRMASCRWDKYIDSLIG